MARYFINNQNLKSKKRKRVSIFGHPHYNNKRFFDFYRKGAVPLQVEFQMAGIIGLYSNLGNPSIPFKL